MSSIVFKPLEFRKQNPEVSVVLPIFQGEKSVYYKSLLESFKAQSFQDFEIIIAAGIAPNGKARNAGVEKAKGKILFFMDESFRFGHERVIENLVRLLHSDPALGLVGASSIAAPGLSLAVRHYIKTRHFETPIEDQSKMDGHVQHACLAISHKLFREIGGESNELLTGTDDDLRMRVKRAGFKQAVAAQTWVVYYSSLCFKSLIRKSFSKGMGSAFALWHYPGIVGPEVNVWGMPFRKIASLVVRLFAPKTWRYPLSYFYAISLTAGFIAGWMRWCGVRPRPERQDLQFQWETLPA